MEFRPEPATPERTFDSPVVDEGNEQTCAANFGE